jgi:hypothetical protein
VPTAFRNGETVESVTLGHFPTVATRSHLQIKKPNIVNETHKVLRATNPLQSYLQSVV